MARTIGGATLSTGIKKSSSKKKPNGVSDEDVAKRAYEMYESRGGHHGADMHDWFEAEKQLAAASTRPTKGRPRT
jgi:hypothetical protein